MTSPTPPKPLPCPFCGDNSFSVSSDDNGDDSVHCLECNARGPKAFRDTDKAIRLWNARAEKEQI
jgi:Lar family restriction alleviation protein